MRLIALTAKGVAEVERLGKALVTMGETSRQLMDASALGLFDALWRMERVFRRTSFAEQLRLRKAGS